MDILSIHHVTPPWRRHICADLPIVLPDQDNEGEPWQQRTKRAWAGGTAPDPGYLSFTLNSAIHSSVPPIRPLLPTGFNCRADHLLGDNQTNTVSGFTMTRAIPDFSFSGLRDLPCFLPLLLVFADALQQAEETQDGYNGREDRGFHFKVPEN
jgi:hypothetical protein